jgi:hypothetical protein
MLGCLLGRLTTRWNGPEIQRQMQEMIFVQIAGRVCEGPISGRSLACLSSPLVLALQVQARCLRLSTAWGCKHAARSR